MFVGLSCIFSTIQAQDAATTAITAGYDKNFFIQSSDDHFRLNITGYIQNQFEGVFVENASDTDSFRIRRARLKFAGHAFSKNIKYTLEYDFAVNKLLTTMIELGINDAVNFKTGNYKVPFELESIVSASNLQFVERSILAPYINIADQRDVGFGINGKFLNDKLDYEIGAFNGEGTNNINQNNELRYAGRINYNAIGTFNSMFSDLAADQTSLMFGLNAMYDDTPTTATAAGGPEVKELTGAADVTFKHKGLSAHGMFLAKKSVFDGAVASTLDKGLLAQAGYFVWPHRIELTARVSQLFKESAKNLGEYTLGANYYYEKLRFQLNYNLLTTEDGVAVGNDRMNHLALAQLQLKI